jgi:tetratricopeptide (TPR) repeat protein
MTFRLGLLLATATCVLAAATASAQPTNDERARVHFQAGQSYFELGRYAESAQQFDEAYRLSPRPMLLANAALAFERAGDLAHAVERLEAYLASGAPEAEAVRGTATARIDAMRTRLAEQAREAEARADADAQTSAPEQTAVARAAPPPGRSRGGLRIAGLSIGSVGIGLGVAALALNLRALSIERELEEVCGPNGDACPADRADDIDRGETFSLLSTVGMISSLSTLALGTTLYVVGRRGRSTEPPAVAFIDFGRGRVSASVVGSF